MSKFYIERNELSDIEFDENDIAQDVTTYEYVVWNRATGRPQARFDYECQAIAYCRENDEEGVY